MPFIYIFRTRQSYHWRTISCSFCIKIYAFPISILSPLKFKFWSLCCWHPLIVKIYDVAIRAIIHCQRDDFTFTLWKLLRKFKNISYRCTSKTIEALVIITHYTNVFMLTTEQKDYLLLYIIGILIFIYHQILNFISQSLQYFWVFHQQSVTLCLNCCKIKEIPLLQKSLISLQYMPQSTNFGIIVRDKLLCIY